MRTLKIIFGLGCLVAALPLGLFAWECLIASNYAGELSWKFVPAAFTMGLVCTGFFLISRRGSVISARAKMVMVIFFGLLVISPALLDIHVRQERRVLQARARNFLLRAIPKVLTPNSEGYISYEYFGTNNYEAERQIMGDSQQLIKRYAKTGRIRWSARIQGQFAITGEHLNFPNSDDVERTNQEVRAWLAERNAILSEEWRMGFWQWIEDTIEMKAKIPEIEEEDDMLEGQTNHMGR